MPSLAALLVLELALAHIDLHDFGRQIALRELVRGLLADELLIGMGRAKINQF